MCANAMNTDALERARDTLLMRCVPYGPDEGVEFAAQDAADAMRDAADEIKRLRELLGGSDGAN